MCCVDHMFLHACMRERHTTIIHADTACHLSTEIRILDTSPSESDSLSKAFDVKIVYI